MRPISVGLGLFMLLAAACASPGRSNPDQELCGVVEEIAGNKEKMGYLRSWIEKKIHEPAFLSLMGRYNNLQYGQATPGDLERIDLDMNYLGLNSKYAGIELNRNYAEDYMDPDNILSVNVSQVASFVIIKLGDGPEFGRSGFDRTHRSKIREVSEGVYVLCLSRD